MQVHKSQVALAHGVWKWPEVPASLENRGWKKVRMASGVKSVSGAILNTAQEPWAPP